MSEKCSDISQNITKLSFPGENLGFTTEIDGRENKEDFLNFPFDHMYACNSDNSDLNSDRQAGESEVRHLKDLLLLHLDLIQQQSDEIVNKDKYIAQLRQENEMLKQRLDRMDRRISSQQNNKNNSYSHSHSHSNSHTHSHSHSLVHIQNNNSNNNFSLDPFPENMTHDTGFCAEAEDSKDNLKAMGLCTEETDYKPVILNIDRRSTHTTDTDSPSRDSGGESMGPSDRCCSSRRAKLTLEHGLTGSSAATTVKDQLLQLDTNKLELPKLPDTFPDSTTLGMGNSMRRSPHLDIQTSHLNLNMNMNMNMNMKETRQFTLRPTSRRKRLCSTSSQLSNNESLASASDERRNSVVLRKRRKGSLKRVSILTTDAPYIIQTSSTNSTLADEPCEPFDVASSTTLEVPRWRVKLYTSCYSMEGTENLDDEVYNRRHMRLENDERRRKRWDVQRIREQRHIERLKQRQEKQGSKSEVESNEPLSSFWPSLEDIRYIDVTDELPVAAFGTPIPKLTPSEFRLPWLNGTVPSKKPPTRKSTAKRKSQKR